eukprot:8675-Prymnesium_polylepis.1
MRSWTRRSSRGRALRLVDALHHLAEEGSEPPGLTAWLPAGASMAEEARGEFIFVFHADT